MQSSGRTTSFSMPCLTCHSMDIVGLWPLNCPDVTATSVGTAQPEMHQHHAAPSAGMLPFQKQSCRRRRSLQARTMKVLGL